MQADVLTSGIWQTNSTILSHRGSCLIVDPAYFPRELAAISARVEELGRDHAVVFTHGHWDHVMGHTTCPDAPVWVHQVLADDIAANAPRAAKYLADARTFDSRWYVPRPSGHHWPTKLHGLGDQQALDLSGAGLRALHLPGHSPDGMALLVESLGLLLVGDYLSLCEIPFIDNAPLYRTTLLRVLTLLNDGITGVIPGHGPRLTAAEATTIARADLDYLDRLLDAAARGDALAADTLAFPRAHEVVGMRDAHRENCAKLGLSRPPLLA
jgi:glyoxylase-like metal-dependent hydrolase (beta-lactamase superfamily II)